MHPAQIKALLAIAGTSPSQLARELSFSQAQVSYAINGRQGIYTGARPGTECFVIRKRISEILNRPVEELWPSKVPAETA
jgi:lambda repressor-like predicted transcriptional regulator